MDPVVSLPGDGETIADRPGRLLRIKASPDEITLTEMLCGPGEVGPAPHVHHEHADCFFVTAGELTFPVGPEGEPVTAGAGTWVMVPPGVVHTFANESVADARFLNVHAPSKGFADYLIAARDAGSDEERDAAVKLFDTDDPPADGGLPASEAIVRGPGDGERIALGSNKLEIKAGQDDAGGPLMVLDYESGPGFPGPAPHLHERTTDSFYVLEGTLTLRVGDDTLELGTGGYALVPPGTVHTFSNPGDQPVRFLSLMAPGGFEQYFRDAAAELEPGKPPDPQVMARIAERYDVKPAE